MSEAEDAPTLLAPRHQRILDMVEEKRVVEVTQLADTLGVSAVTIRTDLEMLDRRRLLRRIRGGATALRPARFQRPLDLLTHTFDAEKERIGAMAARMVRDGETIILDAGTTTLAMAAALPEDLRDVVVLTSSLDIALTLNQNPGITVFLTGGKLKKAGKNINSRSLIPPYGTFLLEEINADCSYLCCAGIDAQRGFTNAFLEEIPMKRAMLASARRTVMLGDHGKIGHVAGARIADLSEVTTLITGSEAKPSDLQSLEAKGLEVLRA